MDPHKYIDVSTRHITKQDNDILEEQSRLTADMSALPELIVYGYCYGWFIPVTEDIVEKAEKSGLSESFWKIIELAKKEKCLLIRIDRDGEVHGELDQHNW
jgi:hypothetical protein